ncbi:MAG: PucR family transcriptional regulator [Streptosporangiales bacterium]|nr:PucR family transcriptional regulator [Streptosporangiales bacterium]
MGTQARSRLSRLLDDLGRTLLDVVASPGDLDGKVTGVAIYDPVDELTIEPGELVLGVGVHGTAAILDLLRRLGAARAVGLVVKHPVTPDPAVVAAVADTGVALLGLTRAASWSHVATILRASPLASRDVAGGTDDLAGAPAGDLFALANAVGALLDAPVTIEDLASRVLAFSGRQDETDSGRVETILGRQVPDRHLQMLEERGAFRRIFQGDAPVYLEPLTEEMLPRVAIAVRAGDELLGSMWAAVRGPLSAERMAAFADSAKVVALHMLRARAGADVERRLSADLLATVLEGGPGAAEAANRLGLADGRHCVMAAQVVAGDVAGTEAATQRLRDALALHFAAVHPRSAAALVGGVTYVVLSVGAGDEDGTRTVIRLAEDFLARVGPRTDAVIGVGRVTSALADVAHSRRDADRALRVLQSQDRRRQLAQSQDRRRQLAPADRRDRRIACFGDVQVESLLLRLADLVVDDGELYLGRLGALVEYDDKHDIGFVDTLLAYLDAFGNVADAAAAVHVHPNTFRYRLRRLCEISGLDLDDPDARLAATLQLRLHRLAGPR